MHKEPQGLYSKTKNKKQPQPQGVHKNTFQPIQWKISILKNYSIPFLPGYPNQAANRSLQNFLSAFLTRILLQPLIKSLAIQGHPHNTRNSQQMVQIDQIFGQQKNRCSMDSSSSLQKHHLLAKENPLLFNWPIVIILPRQDSQTEKPTFVGIN